MTTTPTAVADLMGPELARLNRQIQPPVSTPLAPTEKSSTSTIPEADLAQCLRCGRWAIPLTSIGLEGKKVRKSLYCVDCEPIVTAEAKAEKHRQTEREAAHRRASIKGLLGQIGVMKRYQNCSLANFQGKRPPRMPTFITGPAGTGKTHLAVAYLREEVLTHGIDHCLFVDAVELLLSLRDSFRDDASVNERDIIYRYSRKPFLVLDDLGAEKVSDYTRQTLYLIINQRYGNEMPTIITSNLTLDEVGGIYGDRLASRIAGMGPELALAGKDRRLQR